MKASHLAASGLMESLHDGPQASCIVPVRIHSEHLHRHEDKHSHGCVHQRPVPSIPLRAMEGCSYTRIVHTILQCGTALLGSL
jgi:hypothetical protein